MSWMDSWSRPGKSQPIPPPYYITQPQTKYCRSCGRVISERKSHKAANQSATPAKYCNPKCRSHKLRDRERRIERAFVALLDGETTFEGEDIPSAVLENHGKKTKGEKRRTIPCSAIETLLYGDRSDPNKVYGRRKNRAARGIATPHSSEDEAEGKPHFSEDELLPTAFAGKTRPPQTLNSVNGSIGGEKGRAEREQESVDDALKRHEGMRIAEDRESVKKAARRLVVFGVPGEREGETRLCEAIMQGKVVEPSFAKGDWAVRWRE